ncbi:chromosome segregation protein SMC [Fictibacillus aquaticus]|uniref:Chromosome partition protein Smc n=1 Tax=Fictibacillus aquaticus TaxID=2021314 RepID=A0A235FD76_9BACL|nr:chromosome segregation protein SMC [Fictibacillus aquaticus]OYD58883.1 chromosome segregation protein SMC [Fictibacillus aquaticus]
MFLKRLDVAGFKSFADKIQVDFVPGVTAVVGPNGSGKSNISDAVRWVLGEQSAKSLRGSKMEDIIFAGSDGRKQLNVAEVTLTLDNEDQHLPLEYSEVSVTRRVYRSGDSEYLINKQPCRLKDIVDLFMDSGLGREAYSIIGQGRIEEILSSKPEERRKIFEEAAGVLKYKTRKQKAEQKLSETQDNLNRVEDILHELENQVEPLKIQASMAKDYLEKKEELTEIETALLVHEIEELHIKWEQQSVLVDELKEKEKSASSFVKEGEALIEATRTEMQQLDESINEIQEALLSASESLEKLEGKREVLKERKRNYDQNKNAMIQQIKDYKNKQDALRTSIESGRQVLDERKKILLATQEELRIQQKRLVFSEKNIEEEMERLKSDYFEKLNEQTSVKNEMRYLEEQLKLQLNKNGRLDEENAQFTTLREEVVSKKAEVLKNCQSSEEQLKEKMEAFQTLKSLISKREKEYDTSQQKLYQAYQYIQQYRSKKEMLESMQDDYAGFMQGVKEVLKAKDKKLSGIEGAVAELVNVPADLETAIETALGASMQHVVTDNEQSAMKAIQYLKQHRFGRATFLPLSVIKERFVSSADETNAASSSSFVGTAANLVSFDVKYKKVIASLLGNVIIAKNLQGANEIAKLVHYRYRIVTLEGDVVSPGGSMTGGSIKQKNNSLLGRQRELEELTEKLSVMESQTFGAEEKVKKQKTELESARSELEMLREEGEQLRFEENERKSRLREIELEEKTLNERLKLYDREKESFATEKKGAEDRLRFLQNELAVSIKAVKELDVQIQELSEQKKQQQSSFAQTQETVTALKVKCAELEQQMLSQLEKVDRLEDESKNNEAQLKETEEDFWMLEEEMNSNSSGEDYLEKQIQQKRHEKHGSLTLISERRKDRLEKLQIVEENESGLKEAKRQLKQLSEGLKTEEISLNRLDVELENRLNILSAEYSLSFEGAKSQHILTIPAKEARKKVKLIKLSIAELGSVNLGAIEEYDRVKERFEFLTSQRDDLNEAKETLYGVISEMDEEMKKRFEESFTQIRSHFGVIFSELFGGGKADLVLTQPENMLATGVDIFAQPPGKKLQHLALLSGGERALTAIALLFAILKVRPVPFCILDEVEAALDDANVNRFATYLKLFSKETQFIVVTHRKGTMEEADVLYGVTMQESGISKLVSVKLEETRELVPS